MDIKPKIIEYLRRQPAPVDAVEILVALELENAANVLIQLYGLVSDKMVKRDITKVLKRDIYSLIEEN